MKESKQILIHVVREVLELPDNMTVSEAIISFNDENDDISISASIANYDNEDEAVTEEAVNHTVQPEFKAKKQKTKPKKKRGRQPKGDGRYSLFRKYDITNNEDMTIIRNVLNKWKREGKLSDNQQLALKQSEGTPSRMLSDLQKRQLLDVFTDVRDGE